MWEHGGLGTYQLLAGSYWCVMEKMKKAWLAIYTGETLVLVTKNET